MSDKKTVISRPSKGVTERTERVTKEAKVERMTEEAKGERVTEEAKVERVTERSEKANN